MNKLLILTGPTASGKTAEAVRLAHELDTEILSCDSRQFYREMRIGVARPSDEELAAATHHFIACRSVTEPRLGVSTMPDPTPELRATLQQMPIEEKRAQLQLLDPDYYARVDLRNPVRLQRALEVCYMTGRPYSQIVAEQERVPRPFDIEVRVINVPDLRDRIDRRVDRMMADGLLDEVRSLLPYRHLPTLRTVGYRELFPVLDGTATLADAVAEIKLNTWHYARKQMTWCRRYC